MVSHNFIKRLASGSSLAIFLGISNRIVVVFGFGVLSFLFIGSYLHESFFSTCILLFLHIYEVLMRRVVLAAWVFR